MILNFTIRGNQNDAWGNPIPYKRTLSHVYSKVSRDYHQWLDYVRAEFERTATGTMDACGPTSESFPFPDFSSFKPDVSITCRIWWRDGHHGDVDNVLKGILDALFKNDKCVFAISAIGTMAPDKIGKVEVQLEFVDVHTMEEKKLS